MRRAGVTNHELVQSNECERVAARAAAARRREWFVMRLSFPSEHRAHLRALRLARDRESRTVRVVVFEPDGHVSRYTYKSRFPRGRALAQTADRH